ncbi:MAG: restriction endonuclease subunit S, partial [Propionicimonas sp.]|nr:restriction endonuclease subunit S [Propionicimonas sp.]
MNFSPSQERQHIAETADISPKGWSLFRIKYLLKEIDSRTDTGDEVLLSMRQNKGLIPHKDVSSKIFRSEDLVGYKIVHPGQLVMNRMRASIGLFATSHSHGLVSPDYAVFKPLRQINLDYLVYLFRTPDMGKIFRIASRGMGTGSSGFLRLYTDRFGAITIIIPTFNEQGMIVDFVRSFDKAMSKLIRNKRKLIDLLKEQKQNIITKAVTQGINPDARLKPSGLQWLGNVPEHWETRRLRHICSKFGSGITPRG